MAPLVPYIIAALFGGGVAVASRKAGAQGPAPFLADEPLGFRRWRPGDRVTAAMVAAQTNDLTLPYGVHHAYGEDFMTAVENPTGEKKVVALFVPVAVR